VCAAGDPRLFESCLSIPPSTVRSWLQRGVPQVVSLDEGHFEVSYSNSIIEAYWRSLKHQWLFLNELDNVRALEKLVAFHVEQHNSMMPHSAFRGQTPDEI
jgi:hypothetical protein